MSSLQSRRRGEGDFVFSPQISAIGRHGGLVYDKITHKKVGGNQKKHYVYLSWLSGTQLKAFIIQREKS